MTKEKLASDIIKGFYSYKDRQKEMLLLRESAEIISELQDIKKLLQDDLSQMQNLKNEVNKARDDNPTIRRAKIVSSTAKILSLAGRIASITGHDMGIGIIVLILSDTVKSGADIVSNKEDYMKFCQKLEKASDEILKKLANSQEYKHLFSQAHDNSIEKAEKSKKENDHLIQELPKKLDDLSLSSEAHKKEIISDINAETNIGLRVDDNAQASYDKLISKASQDVVQEFHTTGAKSLNKLLEKNFDRNEIVSLGDKATKSKKITMKDGASIAIGAATKVVSRYISPIIVDGIESSVMDNPLIQDIISVVKEKAVEEIFSTLQYSDFLRCSINDIQESLTSLPDDSRKTIPKDILDTVDSLNDQTKKYTSKIKDEHIYINDLESLINAKVDFLVERINDSLKEDNKLDAKAYVRLESIKNRLKPKAESHIERYKSSKESNDNPLQK